MFLALTAAELSLMDSPTDSPALPVQTQLTLCFTDLKTRVIVPEESRKKIGVEVQGIFKSKNGGLFSPLLDKESKLHQS